MGAYFVKLGTLDAYLRQLSEFTGLNLLFRHTLAKYRLLLPIKVAFRTFKDQTGYSIWI